ncbi:sigma-70 family RNA polymerase sigma factor [Streptomyces lunalinharesii]|uniref:RNA polymerase sigma factor n=2 Tax=Streptomyces lunalinharesii TaxID=333384 RepID=A0ABN3SLS4_9ACTN
MQAPTKSCKKSTELVTLDDETLAELIRLHGSYLRGALMKITKGDRARAEDILQETMVRAWQHPEAIASGPEHARPWLFTVARRIAIDHFRMQAARPQTTTDEIPEQRRNGADPYDGVLLAHDMQVALKELQPQQREILVELHMKGRSMAQAAEALGIPVGTVKSRNFYAVRAFRQVLEACGMAYAA